MLERLIAAIRRYKWLMVAVVSFFSRWLASPRSDCWSRNTRSRQSSGWETETPSDVKDRSGPIRSGNLLASNAWVELLKSHRVVDAVVRQLSFHTREGLRRTAIQGIWTGGKELGR